MKILLLFLACFLLWESVSSKKQLRAGNTNPLVPIEAETTINKEQSNIHFQHEEPIVSHNVPDIMNCFNQTRCIQPVLQLRNFYNVYYCKHVGHGVRFYFLVKEGLLLHPKIRLVEDPYAADIIIYLPESAPWHKSECKNRDFWNKTIMLDEGDHPQIFEPEEFAQTTPAGSFQMIFKRSYVRRSNGDFQGYMPYSRRPDIFPMTYTVAEAYVRTQYLPFRQRNIDLLCTLRGGQWDPVRLRIRQWVEEYGKARGLANYVAGEINTASRTVVSKQYFDQMYHSRVIVTSNPSGWEGDFRFCEALATGAIILIDQMYVPRPKPFEDGKHVFYYNNQNKTSLFEALDGIYQKTLEEQQKIALHGYYHAMKFHRAANLIDYVFRTYHVKQMATTEDKLSLLAHDITYIENPSFDYKDHGYLMRYNALQMQAKKKGGGNGGKKPKRRHL